MEPRLSTSRKWSPLPAELLQQVQSVFRDSFRAELKNGTVEASGKIFPEEILVQVGVVQAHELKQANFVVSIGYKQSKDNVLKLLHLAVDAMASLFEQYFAAETDADFPRVWEEVDFEKRKIYIQYHTTNSKLEADADKILGAAGGADEVAQGDWDEDMDPEIIKAQLGLDDEIGEDLNEDLLDSPIPPGSRKKNPH